MNRPGKSAESPDTPGRSMSLVLATVTKLREAWDAVHEVSEIHAFIAAPGRVWEISGTRRDATAPCPEVQTYVAGVAVQSGWATSLASRPNH